MSPEKPKVQSPEKARKQSNDENQYAGKEVAKTAKEDRAPFQEVPAPPSK